MMIFQFICFTFTLLLLSTVDSEETVDNDTQICIDLCARCDGVGSLSADECECRIPDDGREINRCIEQIKGEAAEHNFTLVTIRPGILDRATRCCPNTGRLRLGDILRIAKYFLNDGPEVGAHILGGHRNFDDSMSGSTYCQRCLDEEEDTPVEFVMPEEESIESFITPHPTTVEYIIGPQTCSVQNAHAYDHFNAPNTPSIDQIQSSHNYYHSLVVPPTSLHDYSHDQLPPLVAHPYPVTQVTPLTAQVHLPHHQHHVQHGCIEPSLTHLSTLNYPQYPLIRVSPRDSTKSRISGTYRNSIWNPSQLYSSVSVPSLEVRSRQTHKPRILSWTRPIVQPLHTLPTSTFTPIGYQPQANNLAWSYALPNTDIRNGVNRRIRPHGGPEAFTGNNYAAEPLLGATNPNTGESNNNNDERSMSNVNIQQMTTENYNDNHPPISGIRSDTVLQSEQATSPPKSPMGPTLDSTLLINIPNTMKRTVPASLRYKQMNKRELKMKAPSIN